MKNFAILVLGVAAFSGIAQGAVRGGAFAKYTMPNITSVGPEILTDDQWKAEEKEAHERAKRTIAASDSVTDGVLSQDYRNLRDELNGGGQYPGIKTPEALDAFLTKIDADEFYAKQAPDAKLAIAQLTTLRVWRSFFNRSMELMGKSNVSHSVVVTGLRLIATGVNVYLPTDQWKAGIEYISRPVEGSEPNKKESKDYANFNCRHGHSSIPNYCSDIRTDRDFHEFLILELIPVLERAAMRIATLNFKKPVYWDNQFAYGSANFPTDADVHNRFVMVGEAERHTLLSAYFVGLSGVYSLVSYNLDGLFTVWEKVGRLYGMGAIFRPDGASAQQRTAFIREQNRQKGFLTLNNNVGVYLRASYKYFRGSVQQASLAWDEIKSSSQNNGDNRAILDPRAFAPYSNFMNLSLTNMKNLVADQNHHDIQSALIGSERVDVRVAKLFGQEGKDSLPKGSAREFDVQDAPTNLCDFLPTQFDPRPYRSNMQFHGASREVHNYYSGMPTGWDVGKFTPYFPNVTDNEGVKRAARILSQTWGGWIIGMPMSALVL